VPVPGVLSRVNRSPLPGVGYVTEGLGPIRSRRDSLVYVPSNGVIGHVYQKMLHWPIPATVAILLLVWVTPLSCNATETQAPGSGQ
jgi:hypothetical protein